MKSDDEKEFHKSLEYYLPAGFIWKPMSAFSSDMQSGEQGSIHREPLPCDFVVVSLCRSGSVAAFLELKRGSKLSVRRNDLRPSQKMAMEAVHNNEGFAVMCYHSTDERHEDRMYLIPYGELKDGPSKLENFIYCKRARIPKENSAGKALTRRGWNLEPLQAMMEAYALKNKEKEIN